VSIFAMRVEGTGDREYMRCARKAHQAAKSTILSNCEPMAKKLCRGRLRRFLFYDIIVCRSVTAFARLLRFARFACDMGKSPIQTQMAGA
jgi:hypothetical protein